MRVAKKISARSGIQNVGGTISGDWKDSVGVRRKYTQVELSDVSGVPDAASDFKAGDNWKSIFDGRAMRSSRSLGGKYHAATVPRIYAAKSRKINDAG